jgi:tetratricopeptide (TPR) repeat protein
VSIQTCPQCQSPIEITADETATITCASCGSEVRFEQERTRTVINERRRLDRFELLEQVGSGAFGIVWKARDPQLSRFVAVKIPHRGHLVSSKDVERFLREARSTAQLRHPGIVSVHEVGTFEELPYLVSDYIDGVTLADLLTAQQVPMRDAVELIAQVAICLDYAHSLGVIHRDVKPSNIMLERSGVRIPAEGPAPLGKPMLMDFGLALRDEGEATMTQEGQVLGTPAYMSPEQAAGLSHKVDRRSDVHSLGIVLYQVLTGVLPFKGNSRMILDQVLRAEPPPLRRANPKVPRDLETITLKCLAKEPGHRYATAADLAADLRRWLAGEPVLARPVGAFGRLMRWSRRNPAVAGLLAALVVVFGSAFAGVTWKWQEAEASEAKAKEAEAEAKKASKEAEDRAEDTRQAMVKLNAAHQEIREGMARLNSANQLLRSAQGRIQRQKFSEALADFDRAVELRPDNSDVWRARGNFYCNLGLWNEAAHDIAREFALLPPANDPNFWYNHALLRLLVNDRKGYEAVCAGMFEHFRGTNELPVAAALARTWGLGEHRAPDELGSILDKVSQSTDSWYQYMRGLALCRAGQHDEARLILDAANKISGGSLAILTGLALAINEHHAGKKKEAAQRLENAEEWMGRFHETMRLPPGWLWHDFAEVQLLYRQARVAIANAEPLDGPIVCMSRARTYETLGEFGMAAGQLDMAVKQRPNDARLLLARSRVCAECNRSDQAKADHDQAMKLAPQDWALWQESARTFAYRKQWDAALADYNHVVSIKEMPSANMPNVLRERGRIHVEKRDWQKVADDFANVFKLAPKGVLNHTANLSSVAAELAQWDDAFNRVIALSPDDKRPWIGRGRQLARLGQFEKAAAAYAQWADQSKPDDNAWLECLAAHLLARKTDAYEALCRRMVEQQDKTRSAHISHLVVRSCTLAPNGILEADKLVALAGEGFEALETPPQRFAPAYYLHALGAAHYRAGHFKEAEGWFIRSMHRDAGWAGNSMNWIFLALTNLKLGRTANARSLLNDTDQWLADARQTIDTTPYGFPAKTYPADWLIVQVLRREAEALMKSEPKKGASDKQ